MDLYTDEEHRKGDVVDDAGFELVNEAANSCMPELHYARELVARWGDGGVTTTGFNYLSTTRADNLCIW